MTVPGSATAGVLMNRSSVSLISVETGWLGARFINSLRPKTHDEGDPVGVAVIDRRMHDGVRERPRAADVHHHALVPARADDAAVRGDRNINLEIEVRGVPAVAVHMRRHLL